MPFNIPWSTGGSISGGGGGAPGATLATVTPTNAAVAGAGSTTNNLQQVSVANIGGANGVFDGQTLLPGMVAIFTAYYDPVSNEFKRVGAFTYDATGTTFWISETP